jgi:hypothetical protein
MIEGEEEYEVECIMNSRCHGREKKLQFLVHWKGYSVAHDSWEDATDVHAPKLVKEYYSRKPTAVQATVLKDEEEDRETASFQDSLF